MVLSRNIEEILVAVFKSKFLWLYEVVPAPEFPGAARYISVLQAMGKQFVLRRFRGAFSKPC